MHKAYKICVLVIVVGFERNYTVNENGGMEEVCVVVTNPPASEELLFPIVLQHIASLGTAGNIYLLYELHCSALHQCFK